MRIYDPADHILYVHPAQNRAALPAPPHAQHAQHAQDECHRLPADYPNVSLRAELGEPRAVAARPALVLLPGGSAAAGGPAPAAPALRLA
jgi:hypothetical protein